MVVMQPWWFNLKLFDPHGKLHSMAPPGVVLAFLCHFILIRLARAARPSAPWLRSSGDEENNIFGAV